MLHLLLLLERGLTFSNVLITIRQPQPDFRHVGEGNPRFPFSKRARPTRQILRFQSRGSSRQLFRHKQN
jgi:hypothetical protein